MQSRRLPRAAAGNNDHLLAFESHGAAELRNRNRRSAHLSEDGRDILTEYRVINPYIIFSSSIADATRAVVGR